MARETEHCGQKQYAAPRTSAAVLFQRLRKQIDGYRFMVRYQAHDYSADNIYFPRQSPGAVVAACCCVQDSRLKIEIKRLKTNTVFSLESNASMQRDSGRQISIHLGDASHREPRCALGRANGMVHSVAMSARVRNTRVSPMTLISSRLRTHQPLPKSVRPLTTGQDARMRTGGRRLLSHSPGRHRVSANPNPPRWTLDISQGQRGAGTHPRSGGR